MASKSMTARVDGLLAQLPLEAKIAQLVGAMLPWDWDREISEGDQRDALRTLLPHGIGALSAIVEMGSDDPAWTAAKIAAVQRYLVDEAPGGIPALVHLEALNGFVFPGAVTFPTPIGLAATFRPEHVRTMARVAARQMASLGIDHALSPVLDVARDARFGRVHETYGEDPTLGAAFGVAFVQGLQDGEPRVLATGKHFLGYALPEAGLNQAAVHLGDRELREVFATPFEAAIRQAGLGAIMNSYSEIDGVPVAASREILTDLLRGELGFEGVVVADYNAIPQIMTLHGVAGDLAEAGIASLEAGLDIELPTALGRAELVEAVKHGAVAEATVDTAVRRVLEAKLRLGLLDRPARDPSSFAVPFAATEEDRALSRQAAGDSIVLLQNEEGLLPLPATTRSVAVVGPFAERLRALFASYSSVGGWEMIRYGSRSSSMAGVSQDGGDGAAGAGGKPAPTDESQLLRDRWALDDELNADIARLHPEAMTIAAAIAAAAPKGATVDAARGSDHLVSVAGGEDDIAEAVEIARRADVAVCVIGEKTGWVRDCAGGEGRDRTDLQVLGGQRELVEAVAATGTPVVAVVVAGRPLEIGWLAECTSAVLYAWHPGPYGAHAIADVVWGAVNPGGKLPISFPRSAGHVPVYSSHRLGSGYHRPDPRHRGRYVDAPTTPLFPFGHGLSYTSFAVRELALSRRKVKAGGTVTLSLTVANTGDRAGDEVVQVYAHDRVASVTRPVRQLLGFHRVRVEPGEGVRVSFRIDTAQLALWGRDRRWVVEPGEVDLIVGTSSSEEAGQVLLSLTGDPLVLAHRRSFFAAATVAE